METKQTHRAGRCGYRYDSVIRRQCKAKTKTLIQIQCEHSYSDRGHMKWEHRCHAHRQGKYING